MKILKWNSYENSKVKSKLNQKFTQIYGKGFTKTISWTSLKSFGFYNIVFYRAMTLSSGPEVQGQVEPSNCTILQFPGKFILAHVHWHILKQTTFSKYYFITCIKSKGVFINEIELLWWAMESWLFCTIGVSWGGDSIVPGKMYRI